ncbi:transcription factor TCP15-like [Carica papaya]|uniref:transcription factor TCP15-like n=1 Tax=Carica papaya TaxID=3649 RepID=UPI000B8C810A|nr:transcription factor TCP15-like [Carica papaya]
MITNKEKLKNLEIRISVGGLQEGLRRMEAGIAEKLHQIETTLQRLTKALGLNPKGSSSHTASQTGQAWPNRDDGMELINSTSLPNYEDALTKRSENQMGNPYLMELSTGSIPMSHSPILAMFCIMASPSRNQMMMGSDNVWLFLSVSSSTISSGVHFINLPTPIALLTGQQLGSATSHNNSVGGDSH